MLSAVNEILIGILTSIIIGSSILAWNRVQKSRRLNQKAHFFKIKQGSCCYITMNSYRESPAMHHNDVYTLTEILKVVHELKGEIEIAPIDESKRAPGELTEFCIGGPDSNERTKNHLETYFPGIRINSYNDESDPHTILVGSKRFEYVKKEQEHVLLAKFFPKPLSCPIFLICGQTAISNRGAAYFLVQNFDTFFRKRFDSNPFCLVLRVKKSKIYTHKMVEIAEDITDIAFKSQNSMVEIDR